ncbi:hypothetical protein BOX15_Mlig029171g2, partial [Macrostomum lignano]
QPSRPRQKLIAEKANNKDKDANIENQTTAKVAVSDTASPAAQMPSSDLHQSLDRQLSLELDSLSQQQNKSPGSVASGCYDNPAFRNSCLQLMTSSPSCNSPNIVGISRFSDAASSTVRASWSSGSAAVNSYSAATTMSSPPLPQLPQPSPTFPRADSTAAGNKSTGFWQGVLGCFRPMWTVLSVRMAATGRRAAESSQAPWMLDLMDILDLQFLASGTQGSVFLGVLNGQQVAMKKFNEPPDVELRELRHLASLRHPNVVRFIGCIDSNISLVMEFCQHGNLFDYYNNPANCISAARVADWAKQLADGMAYLHCSRIVHGDLKSPNILLCELDTLKISDFGLVRLPGEADQRQQQQQQQQLYGTVRWMSPEQCRQEMWSYPADVFSYGVILWEMLFQEVPYRSVDPWAVVLGVGQGTLSLPLPRHTPGIMRTLMEACWACKPKQRPAFRNIGRSLEASLLDLLLLSDGDLRILRKAWSAEIARQLSCMRQEDFKAKLEADLIRKRKEELQHAQEIRQHYEKRLHRVDDLQMDLTNLRMQLQLQARAERDRSAKLRAIIRRRCCRACQQSLRAVCSRQQLSAAVVLDQPLLDATNAHTAVAVAAAASMATDSSTKTLPQSSSTEQAPSMSPDLGDRGGRPRRANRRLSKALTLPAGGVAAAAALFRRGGAPPPPPPSQPSARDAWVQVTMQQPPPPLQSQRSVSGVSVPLPAAVPSIGEPQLRARPGRRRYPPSGATGSDNQQQQQQTVAVSSADSSSSGGVNGGGGCGSGFGYANARLPMHLLQSTDLLTQELQEHLAATGGNSLSPSLGPGLGRVCDSIAEREQRLAQLKLGNDNDVKIYLPLSNTTGPAILGGSSMCNRTAATAAAATAASDVAACLAASLAEGNDDSRDGESDSRLGYNRSASADPKSEDDLDLDVEVDVLHGDVDNEDEDYEGEFDATLSGHQQLDSEQTFRPNSSII